MELLHIGSWTNRYDTKTAPQGILGSPGAKNLSSSLQKQSSNKLSPMLQAMLDQSPKADPWSPVTMQQKQKQKLSL
jgi:hypothetical protein